MFYSILIKLYAKITHKKLIWLKNGSGKVFLSFAIENPWGELTAPVNFLTNNEVLNLKEDGSTSYTSNFGIGSWKYVK